MKCGGCLHHSPGDSYCSLTGATKKVSSAACSQRSDGKMEVRKHKEKEAKKS